MYRLAELPAASEEMMEINAGGSLMEIRSRVDCPPKRRISI
jgi:hypothetical protein